MDIRSLFTFTKQTDPTDLEFMDDVEAALRHQGSPIAYRLSFLLTTFFFVFLVWSCVATRNEVTRGEGQVIPSLGIQPIQSSEGGVISKIHVRENQEVKAGDILVEMANVDAITGYQDMLNKQVEYRFALRRLDAEATGSDLKFSAEEQAAYPDAVLDQIRLFNARREKYEGDGRELEANLEQKRSAVQEIQAQKRQAEENLLLLQEQEQRVAPLVKRGLHPEIEYLNLRQRIVTQQGDLNSLAETLARTMIEVQEEETKLANRKTVWDNAVAQEQNEFRRQLDSVEERLKAGSHAVKNNDLRAPMAGIVRRVLLKEGSVAQRAESILELLPTEDILEVEARFKPPDRGFLELGQNATISVTAFESSVYGTLSGQVLSISPDTIEDSKGQAWYQVRLRTNSSKLTFEGTDLDIKAGMTVTVDVISGEKSVFDYLMKPILKSRQKGKAGVHTQNATSALDISQDISQVSPLGGQSDAHVAGNGAFSVSGGRS